MTLTPADLQRLAARAIEAAREAGQMIARSRPQQIEHKATGGSSLASQVLTEVDRRSQEIILGHLGPTLSRFELGLLAEEQADDGGRLRADHFWCIDPLDGTLSFIEAQPGYSVSIALVGRDGTPWIGVVYDPVEDVLLHAVRGVGVFREQEPWLLASIPRGDVLSLYCDRSFRAREDHERLMVALDQIARDLGLSGARLHAPHGAVLNACRVLAHPPACYFKFPKWVEGGGSLWDFAATACLFHEAGAVATDIHGDPLDLNRADSTFMNHRGVLFATEAELAIRIRALRADPG